MQVVSFDRSGQFSRAFSFAGLSPGSVPASTPH